MVRSVCPIRGNPDVSCRRVWIAVSRGRVLLLCSAYASAVCCVQESRTQEDSQLQRICMQHNVAVLLPRWSESVLGIIRVVCVCRPYLAQKKPTQQEQVQQGLPTNREASVAIQSTCSSRKTRQTDAIAETHRGVSASPIFLSCMHVPAFCGLVSRFESAVKVGSDSSSSIGLPSQASLAAQARRRHCGLRRCCHG